jgi:Protein of unknown function (DUF3108)
MLNNDLENNLENSPQNGKHDKSLLRLGVAILASIAVHALLAGGFNFALPSLKKDYHVIEARIQMPKAIVKPVENPKPDEPVAQKTEQPKQTKPKKDKPVKQKPVEPIPSTAPTDEQTEVVYVGSDPEPETSPQAVEDPTKAETTPPTQAANSQPEPETSPLQPEDAGLAINQNAYKYVATEFNVSTKIDGSAEGQSTIVYDLNDANEYQLKWHAEANGIAALFVGEFDYTSRGKLTKTGLQPDVYHSESTKKPEKARTATFDWAAKKVSLQTAKETKNEDLAEGAQDLVSFMYQFMYVVPLQNMQITIADGKKIGVYDYSFEGEETLETSAGYFKTIRIKHAGSNDDQKTELWLDTERQYIPVKIRKTEKDGKVYEMIATKIDTNRPVAPSNSPVTTSVTTPAQP